MSDHTSKPSEMRSTTLGNRLRADRELSNLTLRSAASGAEISSAYLSQLEAGSVKNPSPHILFRLAELYSSSYADLMRLAGYVLPGAEKSQQPRRAGELELALRSRTPLSDDERSALAEYLAWYRSRRGRPPEER
jgi:transcriptional regulator with XRE-family HTH domain